MMISTSYYEQQNEMIEQVDNRTERSTTKSSKQLPGKAVCLMNAWYTAHEDNPYPNRNDLDYLATNGGIKESQVKAWFSNKRNRTQNTHPKRAKRYFVRNQTAQNSNGCSEPQKIHLADELEQRAFLLPRPQADLNVQPAVHWPWLSNNPYDYYPHY